MKKTKSSVEQNGVISLESDDFWTDEVTFEWLFKSLAI